MDQYNVKLVSLTPNAEEHIVYCARVSSKKQDTENADRLLSYLIRHKHWSPFEMANMCVEVITSRMISPQILRHRSLNFQEYSARYSAVDQCIIYDVRLQDEKNRQNSIETNDESLKQWWTDTQLKVWDYTHKLYKEALSKSIAKELARGILPGIAQTKLEINGTIRSWIHYLQVRTENGVQKEHKQIAENIKIIFNQNFPNISKALGWTNYEESKNN